MRTILRKPRYLLATIPLFMALAFLLGVTPNDAKADGKIRYWEAGHQGCMWDCESGLIPGCSCIRL